MANRTYVAYGFEFAFEIDRVDQNPSRVPLIPLAEDVRLSDYQGVIVLQGAFERFHKKTSPYDKGLITCVNESLMLQRERELLNLIEEGGWVCFLVEQVYDGAHTTRWENKCPFSDTDLCKRMLNFLGVQRSVCEPITFLNTKHDEFRTYLKDWGVARTEFHWVKGAENIALSNGRTYGFELWQKLFFLPFGCGNRQQYMHLQRLLDGVGRAITNYRRRRTHDCPAWLAGYQFDREAEIQATIHELTERIEAAYAELRQLRMYKTILSKTDDALRDEVVGILVGFFTLNARPSNDHIEDAIVCGPGGRIQCLVEVKGVKGGLKREYISQANQHRDRHCLPEDTPVLLLLNTQAGEEDLLKRENTTVAKEHVAYAAKLSVLVLRTIDLLNLMRQCEKLSPAQRKIEMEQCINCGSGWLQVTRDKRQLHSE